MPGKLFVISGPSGAGKGTLINGVLKEIEALELSISATTRRPRPGETHGRDYIFMTNDEFADKFAAGEFLEQAQVHGNLYGTLRSQVKDKLDAGRSVILEIDVQGAEQIKRSFPDAVTIFICPPHLLELQKRLKGRSTDSAQDIERRMINAEDEISQLNNFDHSLINEEITKATGELAAIIREEMN